MKLRRKPGSFGHDALGRPLWAASNCAHDDQVDAMTPALLRWHEVPKQQTYVSYCDLVQISPIK